ncbi:MAG: nucleotidyltransferase domain-containing protein [Desulfonatronovibrio sp.]
MASTKDEIIRDVKKYLAELNRHGIPVQKAILFGSWAKGHVSEESDIDIAVISDVFTGDRFEDRRKIVPLRRKINTRIEPIPYSPLSFDSGGHLIDEIKQYGEPVSTS